MRVTESIDELRRICQPRQLEGLSRTPWQKTFLMRRVSIYFTKLFLELHISANQATFISFIVCVIGGVFFTFSSPIYWLIGIALLGTRLILDMVDGEIARYNKSVSAKGDFWDFTVDFFSWIYLPICMSFGIYATFHNIYPFILGFLGVIAISLGTGGELPYYILAKEGLLSKTPGTNKPPKRGGLASMIVKGGHVSGQYVTYFFAVLICCVIIDCFISPFTIGSLSFNARYICFITYILARLVSAVRNIYLPRHIEARLEG